MPVTRSRRVRASYVCPHIIYIANSLPPEIDHAPRVHPASPSPTLPKSFAQYREGAIQHGPLKGNDQPSAASSKPRAFERSYLAIGSKSAKELGPIKPGVGEFLDRNELPQRFRRTKWSQAEIDAIETGGASMSA